MTTELPRFLLSLSLLFAAGERALGQEDLTRPNGGPAILRLPPVVAPPAGNDARAPQRLPDHVIARPLPYPRPIYDPRVAPATFGQATGGPLPDEGGPGPEEVPAPTVVAVEPALQLGDVVDSIYATLPQLQIVERERQVAAGNQLEAWGGFDTKLEAAAIEMPMGFYQNYRQGFGVKQPTWSGADVFAGYRIGRGFFQPWYGERQTDKSGEFKAGILYPLLRGRAIDKRRAEVLKSQLARQTVEPAIQGQLIQFVRDGSLAYWDWVAAGQSYQVSRSLLEIALKRDAGLRQRVERGDLPEIEIVDNQRLIVSRRAKLVESDRKLQQSAIKLSLWLRGPDGVPRVPVPALLPADFPPPQLPDETAADTAIGVALAMRPEFAELGLLARRTEVELANAQNDLLPGVSVGMTASKDIGPLASPKGDKRPFELEAAVLADVPLQRRQARGRIQAAQGKLAQLNAKQRLMRDKITAEVRDAFSALAAARNRVDQARQAVALNQRLQEAEQRKLDLGTSTLLLVNLREQATADSAQTVVDALADFFKAEVALRAALGGATIVPGA